MSDPHLAHEGRARGRRARPSLFVVVATAGLVLAACGRASVSGNSASALAHDEHVVATWNDGCRAFYADSTCAKLFRVAKTPSATGAFYAVQLTQTSADGCARGSVYFFIGERHLVVASGLAPRDAYVNHDGLTYVSDRPTVSSPHPGVIAVPFVMSRANLPEGGVSCAGDGNAGIDTYRFRLRRGTLVRVSGRTPAPPRMIGLGPS